MPRVSVIVPVYNPGELLRRSLDSVLQQSFTDLEVVVVADGGPEDVGWVTDADERIRLVRQPNRGVSVARNVGVESAVGDLVAFLDQDDEWTHDKLARQVALLDASPRSTVVHSEFEWRMRDGRVTPGLHREPVTYRGLLSDQHVCLSSVVLAKEVYAAVGGFSPIYAYMQDYDLFLRLAMTNEFRCVKAPLVNYFLHDENASLDYPTGAAERQELLRGHMRFAKRCDDDETVTAIRRGRRVTHALFGTQAYDALRSSVRRRDPSAAVHLARSMRWNPRYTVRALAQKAKRR